ncbi:MAG: hypothetical protein MUD08_10710 [Cytophagales bacterium]|jgi:hypothetical protein|nr:hypothetical protein [Cytophagales bacterium]
MRKVQLTHFFALALNACFLLISFVWSGCSGSPDQVNAEQLARYVSNPENGLVQTQQASGLQVSVCYRPSDLLVAQEIGYTDKPADAAAMKVLRQKYDNLYFTLTLSRDGREALNPADGAGEFSDLLQVLSFRMGDYVELMADNETVPVADYFFERTYGMGAGNTLLFVFSKQKLPAKYNRLTFRLKEFGMGAGNLEFAFRSEDIKDAPVLIGLK